MKFEKKKIMLKSLNKGLFSLILIYLVQIAFLTNLFQCFYFLTHLEKSEFISLFGLFSFIITVILFSFSRKFEEFYGNLILNPFTVIYVDFVKRNISSSIKNYPFLCFCVFHSFVSLYILHVVLYWTGVNKPSIEFFYQLLNVVRLLVFPCIIILFALTFGPSWFKMDAVLSEMVSNAIKSIGNQAIELMQQRANKNPKTALAIYGAAAVTGGAALHKEWVNDDIDSMLQDVGLNTNKVPDVIAVSPEASDMYKDILRLLTEKHDSMFTITAKDVINSITFNETLRGQAKKLIPELKFLDDKYTAELALQTRNLEQAKEISMSPLARKSTQDELLPSSSQLKPRVPSILEDF